jgi:hypothetical protein
LSFVTAWTVAAPLRVPVAFVMSLSVMPPPKLQIHGRTLQGPVPPSAYM